MCSYNHKEAAHTLLECMSRLMPNPSLCHHFLSGHYKGSLLWWEAGVAPVVFPLLHDMHLMAPLCHRGGRLKVL